jgi:elongation factor P hydroxylase
LSPNPFSIYFAINPSAAIGIKDVYIQNDFAFYFGKRNSILNTSAYNQLGVLQNELFFCFRAGYRYVAHNTMLEGNLIGDSSVFLVEALHNLILINAEIYFRRGRTDIKLFYNYSSSETSITENHLNMTLSLARNF